MSKQSGIKLINSEKFSLEIERLVEKDKLTYMEAIIQHMQTTGMDEIAVSKLISPKIRVELKREAVNLHFIKGSDDLTED